MHEQSDFNDYPVSLRPVESSDAEMVQRYASDERIAATSNVPHPYPEDGAAQFVAWAIAAGSQGKAHVFAILCDGEFAGLMALNDVDHAAETAFLDYWVGVPFWERGIGTAAARLAVAHAFETIGLRHLNSGCLARNPASARILEKAGFHETGSLIHDGTGTGRFDGEAIRLFQITRKA